MESRLPYRISGIELENLLKAAKGGDLAACTKLFEGFRGLIASCCKSEEDFCNGSLGFLKAVRSCRKPSAFPKHCQNYVASYVRRYRFVPEVKKLQKFLKKMQVIL